VAGFYVAAPIAIPGAATEVGDGTNTHVVEVGATTPAGDLDVAGAEDRARAFPATSSFPFTDG